VEAVALTILPIRRIHSEYSHWMSHSLSRSISNGVCPLSADTISIINYALPDDAIAGDDLFLCDTFSILNAASVIKGQGSRSIIDGSESLKTLKAIKPYLVHCL
jgi:hypothetical protein